jgi:hypothetical protein
MTTLTSLSNAALTAARDCKRKYYYRYERGLQRRREHVPALHFGRLWHKALARWFRERTTAGMQDYLSTQGATPDDVARCSAMLTGYVAQWSAFPRCSLHEIGIRLPIHNPATNRRSQRFFRFLILDMLALDLDFPGVWLWEHKTAAQIDGSYLEKLWSDAQITGYYAALRDMGVDVKGVVYDVALKPQLEIGKSRPTHVLDIDARLFYVTEQKTQWAEFRGAGRWKKRDYTADPISSSAAEGVATKRFYDRIQDWHLTKPEAYHREAVYISDRQVADWREDVWQVTQEILSCRRTGYWYRNTARCNDYFRQCEYTPLCQNGASEALINAEYEQRESPANDKPKTETPF